MKKIFWWLIWGCFLALSIKLKLIGIPLVCAVICAAIIKIKFGFITTRKVAISLWSTVITTSIIACTLISIKIYLHDHPYKFITTKKLIANYKKAKEEHKLTLVEEKRRRDEKGANKLLEQFKLLEEEERRRDENGGFSNLELRAIRTELTRRGKKSLIDTIDKEKDNVIDRSLNE